MFKAAKVPWREMNEVISGWMNGWMDVRKEGRKDGLLGKWMGRRNEKVSKQT